MELISRADAIKDAESWVAVDEHERRLQKNVIEWLKEFPPAEPGTNLAEVGMGTISRQQAIDAIKERYYKYGRFAKIEELVWSIEKLPPIQPEIIHCGDGCKFWNRHTEEQAGTCDILRQCTSDSFYCGNAKRREVTT